MSEQRLLNGEEDSNDYLALHHTGHSLLRTQHAAKIII